MRQPSRKIAAARGGAAEQALRDQEVVRANKELAAYFRGKRTEREARAALKIIKAFVRDRERRDAANRSPLPGVVIHAERAVRPPASSAQRKRRSQKPKANSVTPDDSAHAPVGPKPDTPE